MLVLAGVGRPALCSAPLQLTLCTAVSCKTEAHSLSVLTGMTHSPGHSWGEGWHIRLYLKFIIVKVGMSYHLYPYSDILEKKKKEKKKKERENKKVKEKERKRKKRKKNRKEKKKKQKGRPTR